MPKTATPAEPPGPGLRERGKLDKLRRITDAARQVFIARGYEAATTREIAAQADVSVGTVFVYARDKRELLLMVVNDELDALTAKSAPRGAPAGTLLGDLTVFFRARYRYWASEPRLARPTVRETFEFQDGAAGYDPQTHGTQTRRFYARRPVLVGQIADLVRRAQAQGEVAADIAPEKAASLLMDLYIVEVRRWLSQAEPKLNPGLAKLVDVLGLALRGVLAARADAAPRSHPTAKRQAC